MTNIQTASLGEVESLSACVVDYRAALLAVRHKLPERDQLFIDSILKGNTNANNLARKRHANMYDLAT